jgi:hypothetical protein
MVSYSNKTQSGAQAAKKVETFQGPSLFIDRRNRLSLLTISAFLALGRIQFPGDPGA